MDISEGVSGQIDQRKRVFFWFVCSALGGIMARQPQTIAGIEMSNAALIVDETFRVAEAATEQWMRMYAPN